MMYIMMNNKTFADKAINIAKNVKSSYLLGAFGHSATKNNLNRLLNQYPENYNWVGKAQEIIGQGFYFDCCGLLKSIAWSFDADLDKVYGGAIYASNGVVDMDANTMCRNGIDVSTDFSNIMVGEAVWMDNHIGIYCGNNIVVEATPSFNNGVQTTALLNKSSVAGLNGRYWTKHFKLPWIDYTYTSNSNSTVDNTHHSPTQAAPARYFSEGYAGTYTVNAGIGVNVRTNAGVRHRIIKAIPYGSKVQNFGYFSLDENGDVWLYVKLNNGTIGYIHKDYLT